MLPGGWANEVVRVGDTVHRNRASEFVHQVLRRLDNWSGSPKLLATKGDREILTYLEGHVAWEENQPDAVTEDASLVRVAELVREFHDLTEDETGEVVCHNDLSPKNTVYRGDPLRPVAFIDWDNAAPGRRIHDVAHVCWQYLALGPGCSPTKARQKIELISDAYGLTQRAGLIDTILWWQDACCRGILADQGRAGARLRAAGVVEQIREAHRWVAEHLTPGT